MKNKIVYILLVFVILSSSCSDFLERYPQDEMNDKSYFTRDTDLKYYMNGMYGGIIRNMGTRWGALNGANDDYVTNSPSGTLMRHSVSGNAAETSDAWNKAYEYIRKANYFLENAYRVNPMSAIGKHYLGEGYYCRASKYFELLQSFGGVPYIDTVLNVDNKELYRPRDSRTHVAEQIIMDLDSAVLYLNWKGEDYETKKAGMLGRPDNVRRRI